MLAFRWTFSQIMFGFLKTSWENLDHPRLLITFILGMMWHECWTWNLEARCCSSKMSDSHKSETLNSWWLCFRLFFFDLEGLLGKMKVLLATIGVSEAKTTLPSLRALGLLITGLSTTSLLVLNGLLISAQPGLDRGRTRGTAAYLPQLASRGRLVVYL